MVKQIRDNGFQHRLGHGVEGFFANFRQDDVLHVLECALLSHVEQSVKTDLLCADFDGRSTDRLDDLSCTAHVVTFGALMQRAGCGLCTGKGQSDCWVAATSEDSGKIVTRTAYALISKGESLVGPVWDVCIVDRADLRLSCPLGLVQCIIRGGVGVILTNCSFIDLLGKVKDIGDLLCTGFDPGGCGKPRIGCLGTLVLLHDHRSAVQELRANQFKILSCFFRHTCIDERVVVCQLVLGHVVIAVVQVFTDGRVIFSCSHLFSP